MRSQKASNDRYLQLENYNLSNPIIPKQHQSQHDLCITQ